MIWWSTGFVDRLSCGGPGFSFQEEHKLYLPFALFLLNKIMENKPFFLHFLSRYKDCDATTTHRCDHRTIPNWVLLGTLKKKHNFVSTEGWDVTCQKFAPFTKTPNIILSKIFSLHIILDFWTGDVQFSKFWVHCFFNFRIEFH